MSKAVKAVGNVVKGVGRAVGNVVQGAANLVKKVATSKIGKIVIGAAALYFGVPMISGAISGAGAATGGLWSTLGGAVTGAGEGLSAAWTSLSGAASSLARGFAGTAGASSSLGATASGLANPAMATDASGLLASGGGTSIPSFLGTEPVGGGMIGGTTFSSGAAAGDGIMSKFFASPYAAPALVQAGGQLVSGLGQGYMAQQQQERQERLDSEARDRYSKNVGGQYLFRPNQGIMG